MNHRPMAPAPSDWAEYAPTLSVNAARKRWGRNHVVLARWETETGISLQHGEKAVKRPMPDDFAERHAEMSIVDLARHYRTGTTVAHRWAKEAGLTRVQGVRLVRAAPTRAKPAPQLKAFHKTALAPQRDATRAGQAADYLRRFGPVARCDAAGRYAENGTHWRRGSTVLTADEVVERAVRNGWQPDAWRMVA